MPKELYTDGILLAGESANLLMNAGKAIQGMDYAMRSGILAAETIIEAKEKGDYSAATLKSYRTRMDDSYIMKDINNFQDAVHLLHTDTMQNKVPNLVCDFGRQFFTIKNEPTPKSEKMLLSAIKRHASIWELLKLGFKARKSL